VSHSCGANHVVENVWPFLLPQDFVRVMMKMMITEERHSHNHKRIIEQLNPPPDCYD